MITVRHRAIDARPAANNLSSRLCEGPLALRQGIALPVLLHVVDVHSAVDRDRAILGIERASAHLRPSCANARRAREARAASGLTLLAPHAS